MLMCLTLAQSHCFKVWLLQPDTACESRLRTDDMQQKDAYSWLRRGRIFNLASVVDLL